MRKNNKPTTIPQEAHQAVRVLEGTFKSPGRARFLRDRAAIERAVAQGDHGALTALSAAVDPDTYRNHVSVFEHPELPPGTLRYQLHSTGDSYVIPTAVALAQAVETADSSGRMTSLLEGHRAAPRKSGI